MDPRTSAQDVMRCDLCETALVQMHCDTCLVNLCKACVGEHISTGESKAHKVVTFQDRKSTPLYPGCTSHDNERCTMYCKQCDIPVCETCIASHQHLGHKFIKILQVLDKKKENFILRRNELKQTIYPTYQDIASDVKNRMSQLEKEYGDLSTAITKHEKDWHREIDKLVQKLKAEVDEMKNTQLQNLQKYLEEINMKMSKIKDEIDAIDISLNSNDISEVLDVSIGTDEYSRKIQPEIIVSSPTFNLKKLPVEQLSSLFGTLSSVTSIPKEHGYSMKKTQKSSEAGFSPPVKQLLDEPETVTTIDTGYEELNSVICLSDEEIWTRGDDNTMKLYSINQGSLLKSIKTKSGNGPYDITVAKSGDLVYIDYDDRTVNIVKNGKIKEVIRLQNWKPRGVCSTSSGDLLVIMSSDDNKQTKVVRHSGSTEKQTIKFDDKGKPLFFIGYYYNIQITENKNLDVCVSDEGAKAVVVVNQAGKLRFSYTGYTPAPKNQFYPLGITTDSQSHILTADVNNDCVHIINQDGQFLRYIDCGLSYPWGLCTDTNDNLFVAQCNKGQVKKIKYLH